MGLKKSIKLLTVCFVFFHNSSFASEFVLKFYPYAGIDAQWKHMGHKKSVGDNLFRNNAVQSNEYFGVEINDNFGLEGGYESTLFKPAKVVTLGVGDAGLGYIIEPGEPTEGHHYKTSLRGWHINFLGFSPWILEDHTLRFFCGLGFSHKRIVLTDTPVSFNGNGISPREVILTTRTFTTRRSLLRLTLGAKKMLADNWGIRFSAVWENTNKFNGLKPKENLTGITTASAKNSIAMGLGVFLKF